MGKTYLDRNSNSSWRFLIAPAAGLLPLFTVHICYLWAAYNGHVEWCIPHIDSCTSISATGRKPPESWLFKGLMIPTAFLLVAYWYYNVSWLRQLGSDKQGALRSMLYIGVLASVGLILYSLMLGHIGEIYRLQRRIGVTCFYGFTYICQLLLTWLLSKVDLGLEKRLALMPLAIAFVFLLVGIASVILSYTNDDLYHQTDDAFEWVLTVLLCLHALAIAQLWWKTGFRP